MSAAAPASAAVTAPDPVLAAMDRLQAWLDTAELRGYEPFDGLSSRLRPLARTSYSRRMLVQLFKRSRVNLRPLLGVPRCHSTKAMGYLARACLRRYRAAEGPAWLQRAADLLRWLTDHASAGYHGPCWGNSFDYETRLFYLPAGAPTVVWSALIGQAFVDAFELTGESRYLDVARGICEFFLRDIPLQAAPAGACFSYVTFTPVQVHNANCLVAGLLARVYRHGAEPVLAERAAQALEFTAAAQHPDGGWDYGPAPNLRWIDNWHTGYVLDSFLDFEQSTGDARFQATMRRGWDFYWNHFFTPDALARHYWRQTYPIDIQCVAQSIETLCRFAHWEPDAVGRARQVALVALAQMQDPSGYFYFQRGRYWVNRTPYLHWGQATMMCALAGLRLALRGEHAL
ncbi:MAG: hypothetical protein ACRD2H_09225 [Terriglobales bacterium]